MRTLFKKFLGRIRSLQMEGAASTDTPQYPLRELSLVTASTAVCPSADQVELIVSISHDKIDQHVAGVIASLPVDQTVLCVDLIESGGSQQHILLAADTVEDARTKTREKLPSGASIDGDSTYWWPQSSVLSVEAEDEASARSMALRKAICGDKEPDGYTREYIEKAGGENFIATVSQVTIKGPGKGKYSLFDVAVNRKAVLRTNFTNPSRYRVVTGSIVSKRCPICRGSLVKVRVRRYSDWMSKKTFLLCGSDDCWLRRGRLAANAGSSDCEYCNDDNMCISPTSEPTPCSRPKGSSCHVYSILRSKGAPQPSRHAPPTVNISVESVKCMQCGNLIMRQDEFYAKCEKAGLIVDRSSGEVKARLGGFALVGNVIDVQARVDGQKRNQQDILSTLERKRGFACTTNGHAFCSDCLMKHAPSNPSSGKACPRCGSRFGLLE